MVDIEKILVSGISSGASDIHIVKGLKPMFRINRELIQMNDSEVITEKETKEIFSFFVKGNSDLEKSFEKDKKLDLNFQIGETRLRVNIALSCGDFIFTARTIKNVLPKFSDLGLPEIVKKTALLPQGLMLVTGKSNSGKTTTLNALVNEINQIENKKILMLENPIEYMHKSQRSVIVQKEVGYGKDCDSFSAGAVNALREDCDILVIGEIRDKETMDAAIEMAEAGHLVIGTMHTRSCSETIDRIINFYEINEQTTIKYIVSSILIAVTAQRLIKGNGKRLVMVPEIMIVDDVISGLIRKEKFSKSEIEDAIQTRFERGSISFINSLARAVLSGQISQEQAEKQLEQSRVETLLRILSQERERKNLYYKY